VYLRGRIGALLLAAARVSGSSSGAVHGGGHSAGIPDRKELCPALYGFVRTPGFLYRSLARPADQAGAANVGQCRAVGADRLIQAAGRIVYHAARPFVARFLNDII